MEDHGVIYVATGEVYVKEANLSVKTLKDVHPKMDVVIFTDLPFRVDRYLFTEIRYIKNPSFSFFDKIMCMSETPFEYTLFFDTDILIKESIEDLFLILKSYDLALAHAPLRKIIDIKGIPDYWPEFNTGVIAYKISPKLKSVFEEWKKEYEKMKKIYKYIKFHDQPPLRKVLWKYRNDIKLYILPPEYNLRTVMPYFIGGNSQVRIIHGRNKDAFKLFKRKNLYVFPYVKVPFDFRRNILIAKVKGWIKKWIKKEK